ncbi:hypothetical protein EB809_19275 [Marinobacter sp. R17]|uniref:hypothetical protein n=1 Tax=Marinobacter sp. R17 TaxID=2484250 RepID=UPI000F4C941A|nr:hypothetical protein [Marinobacter sp. R17]ROT94533.1 hypothetical protein EB809_19275 [Marinobacter sp. R17]
MPKFQVLLRGENFPINWEYGTRLTGFYTTRYVRANSVDEAEQKALDLVRHDPDLLSMLSPNREADPQVYLEQIAQAPWWKKRGGSGYTFYPMEEA